MPKSKFPKPTRRRSDYSGHYRPKQWRKLIHKDKFWDRKSGVSAPPIAGGSLAISEQKLAQL